MSSIKSGNRDSEETVWQRLQPLFVTANQTQRVSNYTDNTSVKHGRGVKLKPHTASPLDDRQYQPPQREPRLGWHFPSAQPGAHCFGCGQRKKTSYLPFTYEVIAHQTALSEVTDTKSES